MFSFAAIRISLGLLALTLVTLVLVAGAQPARAATSYSWVSGVSGTADDPTRWSPFGIPDSTSTLTFNQPGSYSVTFTGTVPKSVTQNISNGFVTLYAPDTHALGTLSFVDAIGVIDGGTFVGRFEDGAYLMLANSQVTLDHGAQFTGGGYIATPGPAQLNIFEGSRLHLRKWLDIRKDGTVTVWDHDASPGNFSGIDEGTLGISVSGTLNISAGGYVDVLGPVHITGGPSMSVQSIRLGTGSLLGDSYFNTQSDLIVGKKLGSENLQLFGIAEVEMYDRTWAHVGGMTVVGDSVGDQGCAIRVRQGSRFIASGGLKVFTTVGAGLDMLGGITHVRGGRFQWPAGKMLTVSSQAGTPELWIGNGDTNTGPNSGSPLVTALGVGRGGSGTLRVTRPGTVLPVTGAVLMGDSLGGVGTIVADSSAALAISGSLIVGGNGNGVLHVRNGAQVSAANTFIATGLTGNGDIEVTGPGSVLTANENVYIGGGLAGAGGTGSLVVDSSATVTVVPVGVNPANVLVFPTAGLLAVANGGTLNTGTIDGRGRISLGGGTINALSTSVTPSGRLSGWGTLGSHLFNSGSISPTAFTSNFGRIAISGNFRQFATGRYRVQLGSSGGPRCDTLAVGGTVTLDGTLDITLATDFVRSPGDTFTVITGASTAGEFAEVTWNGFPVTDQVEVLYEANAVRLVIPMASVGVESGSAPGDLRFASVGGQKRVAFELELPVAGDVKVAVYDVSGRHVATLASGVLLAGRHTLSVPDQRRLPSGMYFARAAVRTPTQSIERVAKAVLVR